MTLLTEGLCQYRCTKQSPHTLSVRKLILNFPCTQLAWSTLFSQVRADLGESLQRVFCLWSLRKTALLLTSCLASTYRATPRAPHMWNREVSQQGDPTSPHIQYWCAQAAQNSPNQLFGSILGSSSPLFHSGGTAVLRCFSIGWGGDCLYISLTTLICTWGTSKRNLQHPERFFEVMDQKATPSFNKLVLPLWSPVRCAPPDIE